jgi:uncharacterized lipoprotein YmbA
MTRLRHCRLAVFGVLALTVAACSSTPPALYTIAPVPGPMQTGGPAVVAVQTIGLARYLDRSQIVRSSEASRLDVRNNDWWGEPLGAMLTRVLAEELTQRLPQSTVINEAGAVTATPDAVIEIDVRRLDEDAGGNLILLAQANVSFKSRKSSVLRNFRIVVPPSGSGTPGLVTAIAAAVGQLADGLAAMLAAGR